ncbi:MAG: hypothetical protein Q9163_005246 [Psora crenata]
MPVLTRRQHILAAEQLVKSYQSSMSSYDGTINEHVWVVDDDLESAHKGIAFSPALLRKTPPSRNDPMTTLRITSYSKPDLHERYISSEEEASLSPTSETASSCGDDEDDAAPDVEDQSDESSADKENEGPMAVVDLEEYKAEIVVAVPIVAMGRPKLVDVANIAPMHKRKRSNGDQQQPGLSRIAPKNAPARGPGIIGTGNHHHSFGNLESAQCSAAATTITTSEAGEVKPKCSRTMSAPASWLPEDDGDDPSVIVVEDDTPSVPMLQQLRHRPPPYLAYDPYSLHPPWRLSPRDSYSAPGAAKRPGSVARSRTPSNVSLPMKSPRGRALSWGPAHKRHETSSPSAKPVVVVAAKKPKMLARGANGRRGTPVMPPYLSEYHQAAAC